MLNIDAYGDVHPSVWTFIPGALSRSFATRKKIIQKFYTGKDYKIESLHFGIISKLMTNTKITFFNRTK